MTSSRALTTAIGAVAALTIAGPAVAANAAGHGASRVVGHAYVDGNTTGTNTIVEFDRHADGSITRHAGAPARAGGAGTGAGTASQGAIEQTPNGRFLLAVDAGSNQVSVLRLGRNGTPHRVDVAASHGLNPVSVAITAFGRRDLVYVANAGDSTNNYSGGNYTGFILGRHGRLHHLRASTVTVPDGSQLGDVLFNSRGSALAGTRVGTGYVDSFVVSRNGLIYPAPGSPYPSQGPGPIGAEFRPTNPHQLYVSNAHGGPNNGTISAFAVSRSGALTSIGDGPYPDNQTAPCWVEISHNGKYLFTTNTAVPSLSRYSIAGDGALTLIGTTPLDATTQSGPIDLRLSPNGKFLYVVDGGAATVSTYAVNGGSIRLLGSPTTVSGANAPVGIVVD